MYPFVCVIHQSFTDETDHPDSALVLEKLENIDSETDNLDITFVKMSDSRYARKWGVTKLPAIVYFRKRFPSIYRGEKKKSDNKKEKKCLKRIKKTNNYLCIISHR